MAIEIGDILRVKEGTGRNFPNFINERYGTVGNSDGVKVKVMRIDEGSDLDMGVFGWIDGAFRANERGVDDCWWFSSSQLEEITPQEDNMARQIIDLDQLKRLGNPTISELRSSSYGNHYISFGLNSVYLHNDGTVWDLTCNDSEQYNGWYGDREACERAIALYTEKLAEMEGNTIMIGDARYKRISMEDADAYCRANLNSHGSCGVDIKVFIDGSYCTEVMGLFPRGWGNSYDFYVPSGVNIHAHKEFRTIEGNECKLISPEDAQKYYEFITENNRGNFTELMFCVQENITHRVRGLEPKGWLGGDPVFYVPSDVDVKSVKEIKKLWVHSEFINRLDRSVPDLDYYGNNLYYLKNVKNTFNSSVEFPIRMNEKGEVSCRGNKLRFGRVLAQLLPHTDSTAIEKMVSDHKAKFTVDTSLVKVSDDIGAVYRMDSCGGSCMAYKPHHWFDIYVDAGSRIAYMEKDGELLARALVHEVVGLDTGNVYTVLDRIFFDKEIYKLTLLEWCDEMGYTRMSRLDENVRTVKNICTSYDSIPYIDTLCYATYYDGKLHLTNDGESSYEDYCQNTDGGSDGGYLARGEDSVLCYDTDNYIDRDDAYYCETDQEYYENADSLIYISGYGYYRDDDDSISFDENTGEYAFTDHLRYCETRGFYTSSDDYYYIEEGSYSGSYEYIDDVTYCEDICGYVLNEDATHIEDECYSVYDTSEYYQHSNGLWYKEPENEDDTEEVA